jgi:hypothetical protein
MRGPKFWFRCNVFYAAHFRTYGDSQVARDGEQVSIGDPNTNQGRDVIEAIKVWVAVNRMRQSKPWLTMVCSDAYGAITGT